MGRFIVSRFAVGVRFLLQSDKGRTLALSRDYATLDACKKGICSLVTYLPLSPVVDASAGERGPNPKCEIAEQGGGYVYFVKSPNGKTLLTCRPMKTRKAVLRALSMLKESVLDAEVLFWQRAGYVPLTLHLPEDCYASGRLSTPAPVRMVPDAEPGMPPVSEPICDADIDECPEEPMPENVGEAPGPLAEAAPSPLPPSAGATVAPPLQTPVPAPPAGRSIFGKIKKVR